MRDEAGIRGLCHEILWNLKKLPSLSLISNLVHKSCSLSSHPEVPNILYHKQSYQYQLEEQSERNLHALNSSMGARKEIRRE